MKRSIYIARQIRFILKTLMWVAGLLDPAFSQAAVSFSEFCSFPPWGSHPRAELITDIEGNLYGTTWEGGPTYSEFIGSGYGTVFRLSPDGVLTTLAAFGPEFGGNPEAGLTFGLDGNLYGCAFGTGGMMSTAGAVFRVTMEGTMTAIHQFASDANGSGPNSTLIHDDAGSFLGTTDADFKGYGTIFRVSPSGSFTTLYRFTGGSDGMNPRGLVRGSDGRYYGMTAGDGRGLTPGTIFRFLGNQLTTLHTFAGSPSDGAGPVGNLLEATNGVFYGVTSRGGIYGAGTVFSLSRSGQYSTQLSFMSQGTTGAPGHTPLAGLSQGTDGLLYGTASAGGIFGLINHGTVFRIGSDNRASPLLIFNGTNGSGPTAALLRGSNGTFYATTFEGGSNDRGTIVRLRLNGSYETLLSFGQPPGTDARELMQSRSGDFYGATYAGGISNLGTIYRLTDSGVMSALATFFGTNGANPSGRLVEGTNGFLYGMTVSGGQQGQGTIFKISPSGRLTTLVKNSVSTGIHPRGELMLGRDSYLYGVTADGGADDFGTIFRMDHDGNLQTIHSFTLAEGSPAGGLISDSAGSLYGLTGAGNNHEGTLYRLSATGTYTILGSFNRANGANPSGTLVMDAAGNLLGTTEVGGASDAGVVFRLRPNGTLQTVVSFTGANGREPHGGIILATDGNYYGTTKLGGTNDTGTVFKLTPSGSLSVVISFNRESFNASSGPFPGSSPIACLLQGVDGSLLGTTSLRGAHRRGNVFRLDLGLPPIVRNQNIQIVEPRMGPSGRMSFTVRASAGPLSVQTSSNLTQWAVLASGLSPSNGVYQFVDPGLKAARGFYRVTYP